MYDETIIGALRHADSEGVFSSLCRVLLLHAQTSEFWPLSSAGVSGLCRFRTLPPLPMRQCRPNMTRAGMVGTAQTRVAPAVVAGVSS